MVVLCGIIIIIKDSISMDGIRMDNISRDDIRMDDMVIDGFDVIICGIDGEIVGINVGRYWVIGMNGMIIGGVGIIGIIENVMGFIIRGEVDGVVYGVVDAIVVNGIVIGCIS